MEWAMNQTNTQTARQRPAFRQQRDNGETQQAATFWTFCVLGIDKKFNFAALFAYLDV